MRHWRDNATIRRHDSQVNFIREIIRGIEADHHRVIAENVPRGSVVNARRPGRPPGRSEAESIDDAEHGASIERAMVDRPELRSSIRTFHPENIVARASRWLRDSSTGCSGGSGRTNVHVGGAFLLHN